VAPIETIDVSEIDTDFLGHNYYANSWLLINDLHYLIDQGLEADERKLKKKKRELEVLVLLNLLLYDPPKPSLVSLIQHKVIQPG